ncbi:MAG TPA: competence/damage-inducible protein A [Acidimicrobiia bacterium]|jgi:nicotinamide-nucleotide amidase
MRCEVLAIGTELLLGQIVDTNSAWIGERLAEHGIDSYEHRVVGDNLPRMVAAMRELLARSDALIVCGGLGPTQDDVTREAIAEVMGVPLERRNELAEQIATMFKMRLRDMPQNNLRQADVPKGGDAIPNPIGTAPGVRGETDGKVIYAVPGVPYEMQKMIDEQVLPDLLRRSGETSVIVSRVLKTWGTSESALAEMVAHRVDALEESGNPTIAFLARGIEGLVVRVTAKGATAAEASALAAAEEVELRAVLGDLIFGVDDETMEFAVLDRLRGRGWTLGIAESLTGGLISSRIVNVPGASDVFKGAVVSYATDVKRDVLDVTAPSVVSEAAAKEMAEGVRRLLQCDVALAVTGVAGPTEQDGVAVGTVCFAMALPGVPTEAVTTRLPGDRDRIRQFGTISLLNMLRLRLDALPPT